MTGMHWLLAHCPVLKVRAPAVGSVFPIRASPQEETAGSHSRRPRRCPVFDRLRQRSSLPSSLVRKVDSNAGFPFLVPPRNRPVWYAPAEWASNRAGQPDARPAPDLQDAAGELAWVQLQPGVGDRLAVQTDAPLLDELAGLPVGGGEAKLDEEPRKPHATSFDRGGGDRHLGEVLRNLALAVHAVE